VDSRLAANRSDRSGLHGFEGVVWSVRAPHCFEWPKTAFGSRGLHLLVEDQCPLCSLFLGKLAIKIRVRHETHPGYFHLVSFIRMTC
jgi:hypothetical protein